MLARVNQVNLKLSIAEFESFGDGKPCRGNIFTEVAQHDFH